MSPFFFFTALIQVAAVGLALWLGISIASEDYFSVALIVVPLATMAALLRPQLVFSRMIWAFASGLTLPGLPFRLNLFNVLEGLVILQAVIGVALRRPSPWRMPRVYILLLGFLAIVGLTMAVRGSGLKAFGSSSWGGFVYFQIFFAAALAFAMPRLSPGIPPARWRRAFLAMGLLSLLPIVADLVVLATGRLDIWRFIQGSGGIGTMYLSQETGVGAMRFQSAGMAGVYLFLAFLAVLGSQKMFRFSRILLLLVPALALVLILLSGFRNLLFQFALLLVVLMWIQRAWTPKNLLLAATSALLLGLGAVGFSDRLPPAAQRALSFLPGIHVPATIAAEAQDSIDWRVELWQRAWETVPQYWKIGRGAAFTGHDLQIANDPYLKPDSVEWALVSGTYHNGPLSLLLTFGLVGLVCVSALFLCACVRHLRRARGTWYDSRLELGHQAMTAWLVTQVTSFYLIYGDIQSSIPNFLFALAVLETLAAADRPPEEASSDEEASRETPVAAA